MNLNIIFTIGSIVLFVIIVAVILIIAVNKEKKILNKGIETDSTVCRIEDKWDENMQNDIDIIFKDYNEECFFIIIKKKSKNLALDLELCEFSNEMDYWDLPTEFIEYEGELGFLFNKKIKLNLLKGEIKRFIKHYNI